MTLLLIGGAGNVGTMLTLHLGQRHRLRVLDSVPPTVTGVEHVVGDAADPVALDRSLDGASAVVHLASVVPRGDEVRSSTRVAAAFTVNVGSVYAALVAAQRVGVSSFVHVSTMSVYAAYGRRPVDVTRPPDAVHPYGLSKILAEDLCGLLSSVATGMSVLSLRLAFPTPDEDWPLWRTPYRPHELVQPQLADGTTFPALAASDLAVGIDSGLRYRGGYRAFPITGDDAQCSIIGDDTASVLDWSPQRHG